MKVLSYNIQEGGRDRVTTIAGLIADQQPDAVALMEATHPASMRLIADQVHMQVVFGHANCDYHIAWLSRLPIRHSHNYRLAALTKTLLQIDVVWQETIVPLFATHLASRWDGCAPLDELPAVLGVLAARRGRPHLLVGDFNALRPGDAIGLPPPGMEPRGDAQEGAPRRAIAMLLGAGYVDTYRELHRREPGYTYPSSAPWLRVDYHFASPELAMRLKESDVVTSEQAAYASDHFPVLV